MRRFILLKWNYITFKYQDSIKNVSVFEIAQALKEHWTGFKSILWDLIDHADNLNLRIIVNSWPWVIEEFANRFILDHILDDWAK